MTILKPVAGGFLLFVIYVIALQAYTWVTSGKTAHGAGVYRGYGVMCLTIGLLFTALGIWLESR